MDKEVCLSIENVRNQFRKIDFINVDMKFNVNRLDEYLGVLADMARVCVIISSNLKTKDLTRELKINLFYLVNSSLYLLDCFTKHLKEKENE